MSQENVEIVTRYFGTILRGMETYSDEGRSIAEAWESGELDADSRDVLALMHPAIRWQQAVGDVHEGKLACAKGVDDILRHSSPSR